MTSNDTLRFPCIRRPPLSRTTLENADLSAKAYGLVRTPRQSQSSESMIRTAEEREPRTSEHLGRELLVPYRQFTSLKRSIELNVAVNSTVMGARETGVRGFPHPDLSVRLGHFAISLVFFLLSRMVSLEDVRRPDSYASRWML